MISHYCLRNLLGCWAVVMGTRGDTVAVLAGTCTFLDAVTVGTRADTVAVAVTFDIILDVITWGTRGGTVVPARSLALYLGREKDYTFRLQYFQCIKIYMLG